MIHLGARNIGDEVKKVIPIVNKSLAPVEFKVGLTRGSKTQMFQNVLTIEPHGTIDLQARGGSTSIELTFKPRSRMLQFTEEVIVFFVYLRI